MYREGSYEDARESLSHPDGEEYPGALDWARKIIRDHDEDPDDIKTQYWGPSGYSQDDNCSDEDVYINMLNDPLITKEDIDWYFKEGRYSDFYGDF